MFTIQHHLPYIINREVLAASCPFKTKSLHKFWLSLNPVTFTAGQGHSNWYQTGQYSGVCNHTKFERNLFVTNISTKCLMQVQVTGLFYKITSLDFEYSLGI